MDRVLKIKIATIVIYFIMAISLFYNEHFLNENSPIFVYSNLEFIVAILSLGVILSSTIYNLAFFYYIREIQYLYYALAQIAILILLVQIENLFVSPFNEIYKFKRTLFVLEIAQNLIVIFSLQFIRYFLYLYKIETLNRLISAIVYISIFDLIFTLIFSQSIIIKFVPSFIWILLVLSEAQRVVKNRDIPFIFILIGWYSVVFVSLAEYFNFFGLDVKTFPFLHVAFAIESMLLSFALSYKFKLLEEEHKIHQSMLLQQSRLASMGEMISIIAHQWRQPLNYLSFVFMHIKRSCNKDKETLETIKDANKQLQYMSQTIENFRNFYNPSKKRDNFSIESACRDTINIVAPTLHNIKINLDVKEDFCVYGSANEFEQVILNLINNARDILVERKIKNPKIDIVIDKPEISISDNGGGIAKEHIDKIFEPYFTTKKNSDGIGLYIAKTVIEREMGGSLSVKVVGDRTTFVIKLKQI
jgi:signal transduction histidine kinase